MVLNKLHINMKKCCYIEFKPSKKSDENNEELNLQINGKTIKQ